MKHFAVFCVPALSHFNPMFALGHALERRGHGVTFIQYCPCRKDVESAGFGFRPIGPADPDILADPSGGRGGRLGRIKSALGAIAKMAEITMSDGLDRVRELGADAVLVDQATFGGESIAERLGLPYVSVACMVGLNQHESIPPSVTLWRYEPGPLGRLRNRCGYALAGRFTRPVLDIVGEYRRRWGLLGLDGPNSRFSDRAQVSQLPAAFDFPQPDLPHRVDLVGPFREPGGYPPVDFPWERLTGQPLIYASLGTIPYRMVDLPTVFRRIAAACSEFDAQLVISLGRATPREALADLPDRVIVVDYAPQQEIIRRSALVVTHGGLNTVLDSLAEGVPVVAIPISADQPGVSSRLIWSGAGARVLPSQLTIPRLREAIGRVLSDGSYKENARRLRADIARAGGAERAAEIIDQAT